MSDSTSARIGSAFSQEDDSPKNAPSLTVGRRSPVTEAVKARSPRDVYAEQLRTIWVLSHPDAVGGEVDTLWAVARDAVLGVIDPVALVSTSPRPADGSIPGSIGDVLLLVGRDTDQLTGPTDTETYLRDQIGPTLERLEEQGQGTREQRVDVVLRVLQRISGHPSVARLVREALTGYLVGQPEEERGAGFYATSGTLAVVVGARENPAERRVSLALYHFNLEGLLHVGVSEEGLRTTSVSAANAAAVLAIIAQDTRTDFEGPLRRVLADLATLSAASAAPSAADPSLADAAWNALGLGVPGGGIDLIPVLRQMAVVGDAWGEPSTDLAHLESAAAIGSLLEDEPRRSVTYLFNAGLSLDKSEHGANPAFQEAQVDLDTLGLWVALTAGGTLQEAMTSLGGLDCAVNLTATAANYRRTEPESWATFLDTGSGALMELLQMVARLPDWDELSVRPEISADLARLAAGARRLGLAPASELTLRGLTDAAERTLRLADTELPPAIVVATHVNQIFAPLGADNITEWVGRVLQARRQSRTVAASGYERYVDGPPPAVAAGLVTATDWARLWAELFAPVDSIVPQLRAFSLG